MMGIDEQWHFGLHFVCAYVGTHPKLLDEMHCAALTLRYAKNVSKPLSNTLMITDNPSEVRFLWIRNDSELHRAP